MTMKHNIVAINRKKRKRIKERKENRRLRLLFQQHGTLSEIKLQIKTRF